MIIARTIVSLLGRTSYLHEGTLVSAYLRCVLGLMVVIAVLLLVTVPCTTDVGMYAACGGLAAMLRLQHGCLLPGSPPLGMTEGQHSQPPRAPCRIAFTHFARALAQGCMTIFHIALLLHFQL